MKFNEYIETFLKDIKRERYPEIFIVPCLYKYLWKKGYKIRPPIFQNVFSLLLISFTAFQILFILSIFLSILFYFLIYSIIYNFFDIYDLYILLSKRVFHFFLKCEIVIFIGSILNVIYFKSLKFIFKYPDWEKYTKRIDQSQKHD